MPNTPTRPDDPPPLLQQIWQNLVDHWSSPNGPRYVFGYWGWVVVFIALVYAGIQNSSYGRRFQADNAIGATANAVERIRDATVLIRPGELLIVGMLMIVAGRLAQIRDAIVSAETKSRSAGSSSAGGD